MPRAVFGNCILLKISRMGIFWDLLQESELEKQRNKSKNLEDRVAELETELSQTNQLLRKTLEALESHLGKDIDGDGVTG